MKTCGGVVVKLVRSRQVAKKQSMFLKKMRKKMELFKKMFNLEIERNRDANAANNLVTLLKIAQMILI